VADTLGLDVGVRLGVSVLVAEGAAGHPPHAPQTQRTTSSRSCIPACPLPPANCSALHTPPSHHPGPIESLRSSPPPPGPPAAHATAPPPLPLPAPTQAPTDAPPQPARTPTPFPCASALKKWKGGGGR
jgi:hypothetical protein